MNAMTLGIVYTLVWIVFAVPTAVFLVKAYWRSKMSGFIWLLVGLVVWPFFAQLVRVGMPALAAGMGYGISPIMMMNLGISVITGLLVLVAVIILERELGQRMVAATPLATTTPPPPTDLR